MCVRWEAQLQKLHVPAPRVTTKKSLHNCIATGSLFSNVKNEIYWRFETLLVGKLVGRKEGLDLHFLNLLKCVQKVGAAIKWIWGIS